MAFYYTSLLIIVPLGAAYAILALLFAAAVQATRGIGAFPRGISWLALLGGSLD